MDNIKLKCNSKINFCLKITGKRKIGYHELDMVAASIGIFDKISVGLRKDNIINIDCPGIENEKNSAFAAALRFKETFKTCGYDIRIEKGIPVAAGLGGSSADSAGVLFALGRIFKTETAQIENIAKQCGSDVFYMLKGGYARIKGTGDITEPFECGENYDLVVVKPEKGVNSEASYKKYDALGLKPSDGNEALNVISGLKKRNYSILNECCVNDLLLPSSLILPEINAVISLLRQTNAKAVFMSGSGSACAAVYETSLDAQISAEKFTERGYYAVNTMTIPKGIEII